MELKDPVSIKVNFIFNAGDPWGKMFDFQKDLMIFLGRKGYVGQMIDNIQGQDGEMIVFVRLQTMEEKAMPNRPVENIVAPAQQVKQLTKNIK